MSTIIIISRPPRSPEDPFPVDGAPEESKLYEVTHDELENTVAEILAKQ